MLPDLRLKHLVEMGSIELDSPLHTQSDSAMALCCCSDRVRPIVDCMHSEYMTKFKPEPYLSLYGLVEVEERSVQQREMLRMRRRGWGGEDWRECL